MISVLFRHVQVYCPKVFDDNICPHDGHSLSPKSFVDNICAQDGHSLSPKSFVDNICAQDGHSLLPKVYLLLNTIAKTPF